MTPAVQAQAQTVRRLLVRHRRSGVLLLAHQRSDGRWLLTRQGDRNVYPVKPASLAANYEVVG